MSRSMSPVRKRTVPKGQSEHEAGNLSSISGRRNRVSVQDAKPRRLDRTGCRIRSHWSDRCRARLGNRGDR